MLTILTKRAALAGCAVIGVALTGCSKKDNYAADTANAVDTTAMTASSTAPVVQDTATTAATTRSTAKSTTKSTTKASTAKTTAKKPTY
ncbi:MAG: hypothetical protein ACJ8AJ_03740 [Gemmatimonadaceae bacterium]